MNRRSFLKWLGFGVPAVTVVAIAVPALGTTVPETVSAKLGEWNNYYSEGDPEIMEAIENWKTRPADYPEPALKSIYFDKEFMQSLKAENSRTLELLASRKKIPMNSTVKRSFFQYNVIA